MKLSWLLGSSLEAHHLLAAYVLVWLVQGGYAVWVIRQWIRAGKDLRPDLSLNSDDE